MRKLAFWFALLPAGCVFSPPGEDEERERAASAWPGEPERPLDAGASLEEILRHAYLSNAGLKERWWSWKAALEQIPQDASQPAALAITYEGMFENGSTSWAQSTFGVGNDPMANFVWPGKLKTAGRAALEKARAAGYRFEAARLDLRARVVAAWFDYAVLAEAIRVREADAAILETMVDAAESRLRTGTAPQQDAIKARTQRDLARNRLETDRAKLPGRRAALNALLNRESLADLARPASFPPPRALDATDAEILERLSERNPELLALAREARSRRETVTLRRQEYIPDFGLAFSGDAGGLARSLMAMLTAPVTRYPAIEASIAQAKAELEMTRAVRRQTGHDLQARAVLLLYDCRNARRQAALYESSILPQAEMAVESARAAYVAGRVPAVELLDSQRMRLEIRLMLAEFRAEREKLVAELEALAPGAP
jgi:outer membrane protein, heavy metal efflux system